MLSITVRVNAPLANALGVKEDLAMYLERYGDARVVSVTEEAPNQMDQMTIGGNYYGEHRKMPRVRR